MVELNYRPLSALALHARSGKSPKAASVHVWELPKRRMLTLRIDTSNTALVEKAETAMGTTCKDCDLRWAVTTISSMAARGSRSGGVSNASS